MAAVTPPTFTGAALLGAVPMLLAVLALTVYGVATRRRLEEITADQLQG